MNFRFEALKVEADGTQPVLVTVQVDPRGHMHLHSVEAAGTPEANTTPAAPDLHNNNEPGDL